MIEIAVFQTTNPIGMIEAQIDDVLRSTLPNLDLDEAYSAKEKMVHTILDTTAASMRERGYEVIKVLVTDISPEPSVLRAMNEINASKRMRVASIEKGEGEKILAVKAAEADAESKYLSGVGMARMREACRREAP